jgi:hypothetical protein
LTVDDVSAPTTISAAGALIESPDGRGCLSAAPGIGDPAGNAIPICNVYLLWRATNNPADADFLRAGTPSFPVWLTDDLWFEQKELEPSALGAPFRFRAGPSAPFRLASDLVVRERPGGGPFAAFLWTDTPDGTVKLSFSAPDLEFGEASGEIRTAPGSDLAEIFGGEVAHPAPGVSQFSALRWSRGVLTKRVIG